MINISNFQWHGLTREEQAKYYEKARQERQRHMQMYPHWNARDNYRYGQKKKKRKRDKSDDPGKHKANNLYFFSGTRLRGQIRRDFMKWRDKNDWNIMLNIPNGLQGKQSSVIEKKARNWGFGEFVFLSNLKSLSLTIQRQLCQTEKEKTIDR